MYYCVRGVHSWFGLEDAKKCCNGWQRVFDIPEGAAVIPENPRRIWVECDHVGSKASDYTGMEWCVRCGTRLKDPEWDGDDPKHSQPRRMAVRG